MRNSCSRTRRLPIVASLLSSLVAGCGEGSPEGGSADVPIFQGGIPEGSLPPDEAPPGPEDEDMAAAAPSGVPGNSIDEGTPGDITLDPSDVGTETPGDGETTPPDDMGVPVDMVPVGPPPSSTQLAESSAHSAGTASATETIDVGARPI